LSEALRILGAGLHDGALYVLGAPLALAALIATCLLLATARRPLPAAGVVLFVAAATITRWLPVLEDGLVVPGILLVLGLCLALDWTARGLGVPAAAAAGGAASGLAGGMQLASWQEIAGGDLVLFALLLFASLGIARAPRLQRLAKGAAVGRRMAGAWIAAIGILMLALWWRSAHGVAA
jgi:hypothetical protein